MDTKSPQSFTAGQREREASAMRLYGVLFRHWRDCPSAGCRRARGCKGDAAPCFRRWWRALSEEEREERRAVLRAVIEAGERGANGESGWSKGLFPSPPLGAERVRERWGRIASTPPHPARRTRRATLSPLKGGEGYLAARLSGKRVRK